MTKLEKLGLEYAAYLWTGGRGKAKLLMRLIDACGCVVSFESLSQCRYNDLEGWEAVDPKTVSVRICWLREALADLGFSSAIKTHRGQGYSIPEPHRTGILAAVMECAE